MSVLAWIIATSFAGGLLSVAAAAAFALNARVTQVPVLISYAVGALLGAVFLEFCRTRSRCSGSPQQTAATILAGILLFFVLEKLVLWRHCHLDQCEAHDAHPAQHDHGRSGMMIMVGDTFHNFVDGMLIAAAFIADVKLGLVTAIAIVAHEIPQEVGDFLVLLHSGYSKRAALLFNALSSLAMLVGRRARVLRAAKPAGVDPHAARAGGREHAVCRGRGSHSRLAQTAGDPGVGAAGRPHLCGHRDDLGRRRRPALIFSRRAHVSHARCLTLYRTATQNRLHHRPRLDMTQNGNSANNPPPASPQALFDGLTAAGRQFIENVVGSLSPAQRADSAEIMRALTAGAQADDGRYAELQQRYYRQHLELWMNLARAGDGAAPIAPIAVPDKADRRFHAPEWQTLPLLRLSEAGLPDQFAVACRHGRKRAAPGAG